jgi:hypothetical protein
MTKHELIDGFIRGHIGRRDFIRGLTALGVSASAASAYAVSLGPAVSAAGIRDKAGYRIRAQQDGDYGGPTLEEILELIRQILEILRILAALLGRIIRGGNFKLIPGIYAVPTDADVEQLATLVTQHEAHAEALKSIVPALGGSLTEEEIPEVTVESYDDVIDMMLPLLTSLPAAFATIIPGIEDKAALSTLTSIALVSSRHSAFVNRLAGKTEFPETFQSQATVEEIQALTESIG